MSQNNWATQVAMGVQSDKTVGVETSSKDFVKNSYDIGDVVLFTALDGLRRQYEDRLQDPPIIRTSPIDPTTLRPLMSIWLDEKDSRSIKRSLSLGNGPSADPTKYVVTLVMRVRLAAGIDVDNLSNNHYDKNLDATMVRCISPRGGCELFDAREIGGAEEGNEQQLLTHCSPEVRSLAKRKLNLDDQTILKQLVAERKFTKVDHEFINTVIRGFDLEQHPKCKDLIASARSLSGDEPNRFIEVIGELSKFL